MRDEDVPNKWLLIPVSLIIIVLLANSLGPFRLTNDTIVYFTVMEKLAGTWPAKLTVPTPTFPHGYVYLLLSLCKIGILTSMTIVIIQTGFLLSVLFFVSKLFTDRVDMYLFALLFVCSWLTMKFTLLPLSEMQYLFGSIGALCFYQRFEANPTILPAFFTIVFCVIAIATRTVGIALIPAFGISFFLKNRKAVQHWKPGRKILALVAALFLTGILIFILVTSPYSESLWRQLRSDPAHFSVDSFINHLTDWGEVFVNLPMSKVVGYTSSQTGKVVYMAIGSITIAAVFYAVLVKKVLQTLHIEIYFVLYVIGVFSSPSFDSRFWFPILPFLLLIILRSNLPNYMLTTFKALYISTGLFALAYYSFLSLDKEAFSTRHDAGIWKSEYKIHFHGKTGDTTFLNQRALYILGKYD